MVGDRCIRAADLITVSLKYFFPFSSTFKLSTDVENKLVQDYPFNSSELSDMNTHLVIVEVPEQAVKRMKWKNLTLTLYYFLQYNRTKICTII